MADASKVVLRAQGVAKSYATHSGRLVVLSRIDLSVAPGESIAIVGASGTGKSTLLHLLGLMDDPDAGTVEVAMGAESIGFVFQFPHLLPEFDARENAALPLRVRGIGREAALARADAALAEVGLEGRADHLPHALSGGESQRVAIARALSSGADGAPSLILADEPTGDLDPPTARAVSEVLFRAATREGRALVVATHDYAVARRADRVLRLADGTLAPISKDALA